MHWNGSQVFLPDLHEESEVWVQRSSAGAGHALPEPTDKLELVNDDDVLDADVLAGVSARREALRRQACLQGGAQSRAQYGV